MVDKDRWKSNSHSRYNLGYHLIWCPKYRRKVLVDQVETRLKDLILESCVALGVDLVSCECMPDHVHLFIKASPTLAVHFIVQQIKGRTSRLLRQEFPSLKSRIPTLWTRSYFCESVGVINEQTIQRYIENQKQV